MASTKSPTESWAESPNDAGVSPVALIWIYRDVVGCVGADQRPGVRVAVRQGDGERCRRSDDVCVGDYVALAVIDDAGAKARVGLDLDDGRADLLDDGDHLILQRRGCAGRRHCRCRGRGRGVRQHGRNGRHWVGAAVAAAVASWPWSLRDPRPLASCCSWRLHCTPPGPGPGLQAKPLGAATRRRTRLESDIVRTS